MLSAPAYHVPRLKTVLAFGFEEYAEKHSISSASASGTSERASSIERGLHLYFRMSRWTRSLTDFNLTLSLRVSRLLAWIAWKSLRAPMQRPCRGSLILQWGYSHRLNVSSSLRQLSKARLGFARLQPANEWFVRRLLGWPVAVILGQMVVQGFAWAFFATVKARGLFSYAIRRSISLYLYRPMTLATLGASVSISTRSLVFSRRTLKWPLLSAFFLILAGIQTSGWTTLLTPVPIVISTPLVGRELDLASPIFAEMQWNDSIYAPLLGPVYCINTNPLGSMDGGHAAAKMAFGINTSVIFLGETFSASTAGIWPATLKEINMVTWVPATGAVPPTIASTARLPQGIASNYSVIQQGFTADVSCHFQKLTSRMTPSLHMQNDTVQTWEHQDAEDLIPVTWVQMTSNCPIVHYGTEDAVTYYGYGNESTAYTGRDMDFVMMLDCKNEKNYNDRVHGRPESRLGPGRLRGHCQRHGDTPATPDPDGITASAAMWSLGYSLDTTQGTKGNGVGDEWLTMTANPHWTDEKTLVLVENYVRGLVEYSASLFRGSCTSSLNASYAAGLPLNMSIATSGTVHTASLGWTHGAGTADWVLVPGTLIAVATTLVVGVAVYRHVGALPSHPFDPANPLHLAAAAANGGVANVFRGIDGKKMRAGEGTSVVLGWVPDAGPALVRTGEYGPLLSGGL
ncbi:hypothetical protein FB451DRAFT_1191664 [Mycena latifolia]|nr:hypothetical protein FB451DRAFT_1191664 [Mycena latifolia]